MKKYFGTDGIRGIANDTLTPELSYKLGRVLGHVLSEKGDSTNVLIGRDTRISGELLEYALISGLLSSGAHVMRLGVISTPAVAYLTKALGASSGIMISASHNPYPDNGIKIFGTDGYKLMDEVELEMEQLIDEPDHLIRPINDKIGVVENYFEGLHKYLAYLQKTINSTFDGLKIAIDCANGATSTLAPHLFANLGAELLLINNNPNGININVNSGSTHIETLQKYVLEHKVNIGLAFDGDGDRLIAVDELGQVVDGDSILYVLGNALLKEDKLPHQTIVTTVMSNIGFYKAIEASGIKSVQTGVGDRYVLEEMLKNHYTLGGEQSGHVIDLEHSTTGDGLLTAIQLINIMVNEKKSLSELTESIKTYPQLLKNVRVTDKTRVLKSPQLDAEIQRVTNELGSNGRVLVRASGTEPLIRVMVEAETKELCTTYVNKLVQVIETLME